MFCLCFRELSSFHFAVVDIVANYSTLTSISKAITPLYLNSRVLRSLAGVRLFFRDPGPGSRTVDLRALHSLKISFSVGPLTYSPSIDGPAMTGSKRGTMIMCILYV